MVDENETTVANNASAKLLDESLTPPNTDEHASKANSSASSSCGDVEVMETTPSCAASANATTENNTNNNSNAKSPSCLVINEVLNLLFTYLIININYIYSTLLAFKAFVTSLSVKLLLLLKC